MTDSMGMEKKFGLMVQNMKENIEMGKRMAEEKLSSVTDPVIKDISLKMNFMGKAYIHGQTGENIKEYGAITKCKVKV